MLRQSHERPEGMDEASVVMADPENLSKAVNIVIEQLNSRSSPELKHVEDYQSLNVSTKIVRLITSYTGYVNRVVWRDYSTKA